MKANTGDDKTRLLRELDDTKARAKEADTKARLLREMEESAYEHWLAHRDAVTAGDVTMDIEARLNAANVAHIKAMNEYDKLEGKI